MKDADSVEISKSTNAKQISELYYELYPKRKRVGFRDPKMKTVVFVAKVNRKNIGFILATFTSYGASKFGYLEELFVKENFRSLGIGTSLVSSALKWFKSLNSEVIFVTTDNNKAIKFYKKLGFKNSKQPWLAYVPK